MSDYLFDKQGDPDPEIERLERALRPLAYRGGPPRPVQPPPRRRGRALWLGAGALAVAAAIALVLLMRPPRAGWTAMVRGGSATFDGHAITGEARLPVGAWLDTGPSRARLTVDGIGTVELEPGTRARILETGARLHKMQLERGTLSAEVTAPPRQFVVQTRQLAVIDLGCAFKLTVDESGRGQVVVTAGSVALADGSGREVVVPAGASCELGDRGAGTPFFPGVEHPSEPAHTAPEKTPARQTPPKHPKKSPVVAPAHKQPAHTGEPAHKSGPAPRSEPAQKKPADKFGHDPFKDVERSTPP